MNTLVVIWEGADLEFLKKYDCSNIQQKGFYDLDTSLSIRSKPDEVIACLLTGKSRSEHNIKGDRKFENQRLQEIEQKIKKTYLGKKTTGLRNIFYESIQTIDSKKRRHVEVDYETENLFDKIDKSKAVSLPTINPEPQYSTYRNTIRPEEFRDLGLEECEELIEKNYLWRQKQLSEALEEDINLAITQIQLIDSYQHIYYENEKYRNLDKIEKTYRRADNYAEEIIETAKKNGFERIIFLSEYGRPESDSGSHIRNSFYSTNSEDIRGEKSLKDMYLLIKSSAAK